MKIYGGDVDTLIYRHLITLSFQNWLIQTTNCQDVLIAFLHSSYQIVL